MDRGESVDPFATEPQSTALTKHVPSVPVVAKKLMAKAAVPSRVREGEVQQLIHDLAVLAAAGTAPPGDGKPGGSGEVEAMDTWKIGGWLPPGSLAKGPLSAFGPGSC